MLIRGAELGFGAALADLRISAGCIAAVAPRLALLTGEEVIEAQGALLIPGLCDHHIHLWATAAALESLPCGPPQVTDAAGLRRALQAHDATLSSGAWLRGIGYHPAVAGDIDRHWLDACIAQRPVRVQHRSGRLWIFNTAGLQQLVAADADAGPLERDARGHLTGRLYDADDWLRTRIGRQRPDLARVSRSLAAHGVTAVTDTSPGNGPQELAEFVQAQQAGELLQRVLMMGNARLDGIADPPHATVRRGAHKFHLHEHHLPDLDAVSAAVRASHASARGAAFHCVTRTELAFALAVLEQVGTTPLDRIEHAGVVPPELVDWMARLGVAVVTQPGFVHERGDAYLAEVEPADQPWLYRLRGLLQAGLPLAGSSDAPFGGINPWQAIAAAVSRRTARGRMLGSGEALSPEQALALFTSSADAPGRRWPRLQPGEPADLCLLPAPWQALRADPGAIRPAAVFIAGVRVDELHHNTS